MWGITGGTTVRPAIYDIIVGSVATPADNSFHFRHLRTTAAGTSTAFTPVSLDPADPASTTAAGTNHTVAPTATANSNLLDIAGNQRACVRWIAAPGGELKVPATAANGIACTSVAVGGSAVAMIFTIAFEE